MKKRTTYLLLTAFASLSILIYGCSKDEEPANPYDNVDYSTHTDTPEEPDPNSIVGLHKNIFLPRCANPGCHDGTFEPDFRTVESSYSTLVYQPVNKFTLDSAKIYSLRCIPNNVDDSWLIERLVTSTTEYMPSNSVRLTTEQINHVKNWINAGCPDANGNLPVRPDLMPNIQMGYAAMDSMFLSVDTARGNFWANPFLIPQGISMYMAFSTSDSADGIYATDPANFTVKEIRFSTNKDDFSSAITIPCTQYLPTYSAWLTTVPTSIWPTGTTVYFRFYVNDGHHSTNTEFPKNQSMDYYKTYYAFTLQ
ncbi:MAG: hypothetical protein U0X76_10845 [Bacteroidia bacterium]